MKSATDEDGQDYVSGMAGEALAIGLLTVVWIAVVASTQWLAALHDAVPTTVQALILAGVTAGIMLTFLRWSGGHLNPLMTLAMGLAARQNWRPAIAYSAAHIAGALTGVSLMFAFVVDRPDFPLTEGRVIAEFLGALFVVAAMVALRFESAIDAALGVGAAVAMVYWISGGATLVNPAITLAQGAFGIGLNMMQAGPVIAAQFFGALTGYYAARIVWP